MTKNWTEPEVEFFPAKATELMFIASVGFLLWQFRHNLLYATTLLKSISMI